MSEPAGRGQAQADEHGDDAEYAATLAELSARALEGSADGLPLPSPSDAVRVDVARVLGKYGLSEARGFLPVRNPLVTLPARYDTWSEPQTLRALLLADALRDRVLALPPLVVPVNEDLAVLQRLHSLLALVAHAYLTGDVTRVHWERDVRHELPPALAAAFMRVSELIEHVPVITHADTVLWNWRRFDESDPELRAEKLELMIGQLKSTSESWFFLVTTELEWRGAAALGPVVRALALAASASDEHDVAAELTHELLLVADVVRTLTASLLRMRERCVPSEFYAQVRPYVAGWERGSGMHPRGVIYRGCLNDAPQHFYGASAAQSALVQTLDTFFGIVHASPYLRLMRLYMPREHRHFVNDVAAASPALRSYVTRTPAHAQHAELAAAWASGLEALREFRSEHLKIASQYIVQQAPRHVHGHAYAHAALDPTASASSRADDDGAGERGTGGTALVPFLKQVRDETR